MSEKGDNEDAHRVGFVGVFNQAIVLERHRVTKESDKKTNTNKEVTDMLSRFRKNEKGFTLVELMIVIAIIGILAAIAIPQFAAYRTRGFNSSAQSDVRNLATSEAAFFADWQMFGETAGDIDNDTAAANGGAGTVVTGGDTTNFPKPGIMALDTGNNTRTIAIPVGNGVSVVASTNDNTGGTEPRISFVALSKHLQGDTYFGMDSDSTAVYQCVSSDSIGTILAAGDEPTSNPSQDDFNGATGPGGGTYVIK